MHSLEPTGPPSTAPDTAIPRSQLDPRLYQIGILGGLLLYGVARLDFEIGLRQIGITLTSVLAMQWLCAKAWRLPAFEVRSALISGLSLCLLLRTNSLALAALTAGVAITSKFIFRWRGKHLFNPTNFGLVAAMLATDGRVWVSPGQWGNAAFFGFLMACLGGLVITRAARGDVTMAFLIAYLGFVFGRTFWLGEPMAIPLHRLQSGSLLLFAFFMISDPKTTPDSTIGRLVFAVIAAYGGWYIQFRLFHTNGLLWSLAASALLVPALDWLFPGSRYRWNGTSSGAVFRKPSVFALQPASTFPTFASTPIQ